jgi:hypothetical protein
VQRQEKKGEEENDGGGPESVYASSRGALKADVREQ